MVLMRGFYASPSKKIWFILVGEHLWSLLSNPSSCLAHECDTGVLWDNLGFKACTWFVRVAIKKGLDTPRFFTGWHLALGCLASDFVIQSVRGIALPLCIGHMWVSFYMSLNQVLIDMTLATFNCILYIPPPLLSYSFGESKLMSC